MAVSSCVRGPDGPDLSSPDPTLLRGGELFDGIDNIFNALSTDADDGVFAYFDNPVDCNDVRCFLAPCW